MRDRFDREPGLLYLSGANQSLLPRSVLESLQAYQRAYERNPTEGMARAWGDLWAAQTALARFLGVPAEELFLRPSATSVLNTLLLGVKLEPGAEILVGELEYGAVVNILRLRGAREKVSLRVLKMPVSPAALRAETAASLTEHVVSQLGPRTRLLVLSHVVTGTGLVFPVAEIARETRRRGVFFVVDGTHAVGALPFTIGELADVDAYGSGLYKWTLGPKGAAFGWVPARNQALVEPIQAGWTTFEPFEPLRAFGGGNRFQEAFLLHGCHDFAPFVGIGAMVDFWERETAVRIHLRRRSLWEGLRERMAEKVGWTPLVAGEPARQGPLLVYRLPERLQAAGGGLVKRLAAEHRLQTTAVCLHGRWHLVLSPHVYNDEAELDVAVRVLAGL